MISIWFFIGLLLVAYGLLILGGGLYDQAHPAAHPVVFSSLHAGIWWGALLLLLGSIYLIRFYPRKKS